MLKTQSEPCTQCKKPLDLCMCEWIKPLKSETRILILQHPQEPDHEIGSAWIAHRMLPNSQLRIGLSWPNLSKALGETAIGSQWGVLYLGSGIRSQSPAKPGLHFVTKKGEPAPNSPIQGLVVLDGTWSQAKALWWRNPWLLKLKRTILVPQRKSLYGALRKEPRRECLSTIESIAEALDALGEPEQTGEELRNTFSKLLDKKRARFKMRDK